MKQEKAAKKAEKADKRAKAPKKADKKAAKTAKAGQAEGGGGGGGEGSHEAAAKTVAKAHTRDSLQALSKLGERVDASYRIVSQPPTVVPARGVAAVYGMPADQAASALEPYVRRSHYRQWSEQVVQGKQMMQAASDICLGWTKGLDVRRHFYWRQLRDMKGSALVEAVVPLGLNFYAGICGWTLARAHARSGDPVAMAEYLGTATRSTSRSPNSRSATPTRTRKITSSSCAPPSTSSALAEVAQGGTGAWTMAGAQPESPVTDGIRTLEVRWILPGELQTVVAGWFGQFTARTESRQDAYLISPHLPGLSVKVRGGRALEVKVYGGSPGILELAGRARGRMESWQKWSFPCGRLGPAHGELAGWRQVRKRRRIGWFSRASEPVLARVPAPGEEPRCTVELTEVAIGSEAWWSLGFEATGAADLLRAELQASAALVFAEGLPDGTELGMEHSRSYAKWLWQQSDAGGGELTSGPPPVP